LLLIKLLRGASMSRATTDLSEAVDMLVFDMLRSATLLGRPTTVDEEDVLASPHKVKPSARANKGNQSHQRRWTELG
jgi:hypothetical protein